MAYYRSRYGYRLNRNQISTYKSKNEFISIKYKINAPTPEEFGITESDIISVKKEHEEWKRLSTYNGHLKGTKEAYEDKAFELAGVILKILLVVSAIAGVIYGIVEMEPFGKVLGYAIGFPIAAGVSFGGALFFYSMIIAGIVAKLKNKTSTPRCFPQQNKLEKISAFEAAIKEHEYWQNRKREEYWCSMNGRTFEKEINDLFIRHGYKTVLCKGGGDGGIDIIAEKEKIKVAIQCKAHANKISPSVARDLLGTVTANGFNKGYLITLNGGTNGTIEFCKNNGLTIWDVKDILRFQQEN